MACVWSASVTSTATAMASPPDSAMSLAVASAPARSRSQAATRAPAAAKANAEAAPIPDAAPVTSATLPVRFGIHPPPMCCGTSKSYSYYLEVPSAAALRRELRAFLSEHHPGRPPKGDVDRLRFEREWAALLADSGWAAPAWPKEWGGMDLPAGLQLVYHEEMARARVPSHPSPNSFIVGPAILRHGTPEQKERFLRPIVRADELWCQGFSEPGAGSDLAALSTRATRRGDEYVVAGQKVWTSRATEADWMFALVRTGPPGSRADGITYLLIDMASPGITVRPLRDMTGGAFFAEVFFDDVRVPVAQRVGDENGGWAIARTSLGHERSTSRVAMAVRYRRVVDELFALARTLDRSADPVVRQEL